MTSTQTPPLAPPPAATALEREAPAETSVGRGDFGRTVLGTLLSRVLGLLREVVFAHYFGASARFDAFVVAFRIPNTFRNIVGEGAMNAAFVPVYARLRQSGDDARVRHFEASILRLWYILLAVLTVAGIAAMPWLVTGFASGWKGQPGLHELAIDIGRVTFGCLFFYGLYGIYMGILNTRGYFGVSAVSPALMNLAFIVAVLGGYHSFGGADGGEWTLAIGALVGAFLQTWLPARQFRKLSGINGRMLGRRAAAKGIDPEVWQVGRLMLPALAGLAVYQLHVIAGTTLASYLPQGSVSALFYADRLVQLPLGMLATAAGVVSLPVLARAREEPERFASLLADGLRMSWVLLLPATAALAVAAKPLIGLLYVRGAFTQSDAVLTSACLQAYALALCGAGGVRVMINGFYADQDTRTPVVTSALALLLMVSVAIPASRIWGAAGIAAGTAVASWAQFILIGILLASRGRWRWRLLADRELLRQLAATAAMTAALVAVLAALDGQRLWVVVPVIVIAGATIYTAVALGLGSTEAAKLYKAIRRRLK